MTGAVEVLVVDVQCVFPAMADLSRCFHTRFISTSRQALFPGGIHIPYMEECDGEIARTIVRTAVEAFPLRDQGRVHIPREVATARAGFGVEEIRRHLGGNLEPLVEALASGRIRGIDGIVGCNNLKVRQDHLHINLTKELISRDILVVGIGCWAIGVAKAGLMDMAVIKETSVSLRGFCLDHDSRQSSTWAPASIARECCNFSGRSRIYWEGTSRLFPWWRPRPNGPRRRRSRLPSTLPLRVFRSRTGRPHRSPEARGSSVYLLKRWRVSLVAISSCGGA
jgi:hydroxylamine reductase (hybrid-cluster protein)